MIKFKALAMKAKTNDRHMMFLLKKNVKSNIIKTILGYPPIVIPESLKEWKVAITSVGQEYKSTKEKQDYKTGSEIIYRGVEIFIDVRKTKDNYDKDRKPRCFNCNVYEYMVKDC